MSKRGMTESLLVQKKATQCAVLRSSKAARDTHLILMTKEATLPVPSARQEVRI